MQFVVPDFIYKNYDSICIGIEKGLTEKADFDFMEFCNVKEWMLGLNQGKTHCE